MAMCKEKREWERLLVKEANLQALIDNPETPVEVIREGVAGVVAKTNKMLDVVPIGTICAT